MILVPGATGTVGRATARALAAAAWRAGAGQLAADRDAGRA
ncbi:MAG TPA: hypothetical protein VFU46_00755 [Gemmatimonadales bacterium]|nr:hypothetical protein [Gemmatimonadales bacterium]